MPTSTETLLAYARLAPVIPVVTIDDARRSIDLAQTLVAAGLPVVEVTLRTAAAMDAIAAIAKAVPEAVIAAGTVTEPSQIREVADAGAKFIVTPGTPVKLAEALADAAITVMPGCATPSEAMTLMAIGFQALKFFPAAASGGTAWLKGVHGPLPALRFIEVARQDAIAGLEPTHAAGSRDVEQDAAPDQPVLQELDCLDRRAGGRDRIGRPPVVKRSVIGNVTEGVEVAV